MTVTGVITRMAEAVVEGNSHYYVLVEAPTRSLMCPWRTAWILSAMRRAEYHSGISGGICG